MNVADAAEVLSEHTTLELECDDCMYLNVYVPIPQPGVGAPCFIRKARGNPVAIVGAVKTDESALRGGVDRATAARSD